jgi:hypothetical protein
MALNSTGPISLGGATSGQSINLELQLSATATVSLNDASVRGLAGVAGSGTQISLSGFYSKSYITFGLLWNSYSWPGPLNYPPGSGVEKV